MKDNVDLTIDRKFSVNRIADLRNVLFKLTNNAKFPWVMNTPRITSTLNKSNSPVLTGNKKERANKKIEIAYMNVAECERCGFKFDIKPWNRGEYLLCKSCDDYLNEEVTKSYWLEQRKRFVKINKDILLNNSREDVSLAELVLKVEEA